MKPGVSCFLLVVMLISTFAYLLSLLIPAVRFKLSCPDRCWCDPVGIVVDCNNACLQNIPVIPFNSFTSLAMDNNNLTELRKDVFRSSDLAQLEKLSINKCNVQCVEPETFSGLLKLEVLSLDDNELVELKSRTFENLTRLESLSLSSSSIQVLESGVFIGLFNLDSLWLDGNNIQYLYSDLFKSLHKLDYLNLRNNPNLTILNNEPVFNLPNLHYLYLSNCNLSFLSGVTFAGAKNISYLDLSENKLATLNVESFGKLSKLSDLYINGNPLICDCRLKELWTWCHENNVSTDSYGQVPECDSPGEVSGYRWYVLQKSQCTSENISYIGDYKDLRYEKSEFMYENDKDTFIFICKIVFLILFGFGATMNVILIIIITCNKQMRTIPNMYILNIAVSDLLLLILHAPIVVVRIDLNSWPFGELACQAFYFIHRLPIGLSAYSVSAFSMQRYHVTVTPLQSHLKSHHGKRNALISLFGVWVLSSAHALPSAISAHAGVICSPYHSRHFYRLVVLFELFASCIFPLCIIVSMYAMTARHLVKSSVSLSEESRHPQENSRRNTARIVLGLCFVFVVCYVPYHIILLNLIWDIYSNFEVFYFAFPVSIWLLLINSCFNPLALYWSSNIFRNYFKYYLFFCCKRVKRTFSKF